MVSHLKSWAGWLVVFVILIFFLMRYHPGWSFWAQMLFFFSILGFVALYEKYLKEHPWKVSFIPYHVRIYPHYEELMRDFKLLRDDEELIKASNKGMWDTYISFTVLQVERKGDGPRLVYWDSRNSFKTNADFQEFIRGISFRKRFDGQSGSPVIGYEASAERDISGPTVYCHWTSHLHPQGCGYEMGLTVRQEWWDWIRSTDGEIGELSKKIGVRTGHYAADLETRETSLALAFLPFSEIQAYYRTDRNEELKLLEKQEEKLLKLWEKQQELREREIAAWGWKRDEIGDGLEHRYFSVSHISI